MTRIMRVYTKSGVDTDAAPGEDASHELWCKVRRAGGEEGEISYASAAKALFSKLHSDRQNIGKKVKIFPGYDLYRNGTVNIIVHGKRSVLSPSSIEGCGVLSPSSIEGCGSLAPKDHNIDMRMSSYRPELGQDNPFAAMAENKYSDDNADVDVEMSQDSSSDFVVEDNSSRKTGPFVSAMHPTLANSCWRSLNSSEAHNGFAILMHLESAWNSLCSQKLSDFFSEFLIHGPKSEGTRIREPHRTELAFIYMEKVMVKLKLDQHQIKHHIGPSTAAKLEQILELPMSETVDAAYGKMSESETSRMAQALQFSSKSLGFVAKSITMELKDIVNGSVQPTEKLVNSMPFVSLFLKTEIRDCLKMVVRSAMKSLLRHGHWLTGCPGEGRRLCKTSHEQKCATETQSCIKAFGTIVSHAAWLHCAKEEIPFADASCCCIIQAAVESEVATIDFAKMSEEKFSVKDKDKYESDMKLRFIFSLNSTMSKELQMRLSELFDVSTEVRLVLA